MTAAVDNRAGRPEIIAKTAEFAAPIALVVLWVAFFVATPNFLTVDNIGDLLVASTILTVLALGQQFAVVVGGIDLSVGANLPWAAALLGYTTSHGYSVGVGIVVAVLGGLAVGFVNGVLVGRLHMTDFVVTLGSLSVVSGFTLLLTHGNTVAVNSRFLQRLALDGIGPVRWFWLLALVAALIVAGIIFRTRVGTHLLATGGRLEAARDTGIAVDRIRLLAYCLSGLLCGVAGVMLVARNGGADPSLQTTYLLSSIAAVVLGGSSLSGGKASVLGTVCGAVLFTSLINGFTILGISQYYQPIAVGAVLLLAAAISRFRK
ncbi:ABC transporter permease [Nocardia terpenica]|uniref:ABC transporter permease n=1 Tax=Nocardia terpenica TaxID=455432 RepID=A0A164J234_9NOCA|nr:ABC transporter permease [Nocardia terpenica]KZM69966.1 ABC transporter permease [Nocardia terpenica]MBF6065907.1 ABC transporter permease [Nocardia terpenica]MBF6108897.1 ABC transporter permease [Nocardia terpenica]MBF6116151.1 ABC transporter permease [Nocardia terpenica]MBF6123152.1 ABC transporter permease [Nocardia terpenica]